MRKDFDLSKRAKVWSGVSLCLPRTCSFFPSLLFPPIPPQLGADSLDSDYRFDDTGTPSYSLGSQHLETVSSDSSSSSSSGGDGGGGGGGDEAGVDSIQKG